MFFHLAAILTIQDMHLDLPVGGMTRFMRPSSGNYDNET